jgi:hypothetical protein
LSLTLSQFYTILDCCKSQFVYRHFGGFLARIEPAGAGNWPGLWVQLEGGL